MEKFPKIVATFAYTGPVNRLRTRLTGAILNSIRPQILALRDAAELTEKIKIVEVADGIHWEYYPKVITTRPFTPEEHAQLESARQTIVSTLQSALEGEGATEIVIHSTDRWG